jgi:hypothetical protein
MPPNVRYALFMSLLVFIGIMGIILVVMLMGAWRRHLARQRGRRVERQADVPTDIWHVSGQRLQDSSDDEADAKGDGPRR